MKEQITDITITLNTQKRVLPAGTTIRDLMNAKDIRKAAVWVNGEQLLKAQYDTWVLHEGDTVRLLRIMAGG